VPAPPLSLAGADAVAVDRGVNTAGAEAVPSRLADGDGVCGGEPVALAPVDAEWVDAADAVGSAVPVAATDAPAEPVGDAEGVGGALAGALPVPLPVPLPLNDGELEALGEPADDAEGTREAEVEGEGVEEPTRGVAVAGGEGVTVPPPLAVAVGAPPLPVAGGEGDCVMETVPAPVAPAVPVPPPLPDAAADGEGGEEGEGSPGVRDAGSVAVGGGVWDAGAAVWVLPPPPAALAVAGGDAVLEGCAEREGEGGAVGETLPAPLREALSDGVGVRVVEEEGVGLTLALAGADEEGDCDGEGDTEEVEVAGGLLETEGERASLRLPALVGDTSALADASVEAEGGGVSEAALLSLGWGEEDTEGKKVSVASEEGADEPVASAPDGE
jgi:hypothetical protein